MSEVCVKPKLMRALVVEDSLVTQRLITLLLDRLGFEVAIVENGADAIKAAKTTRCDIIFLDVMMPMLDGYQVCKILKANKSTKGIPVVMLTSRDGMFDKVRGKMAGSDVYLTKPLQHKDLLSATAKFFPIRNGVLDLGVKEASSTRRKPKYKFNDRITPVVDQNRMKQLQSQNKPELVTSKNRVINIAERLKNSKLSG